jgi:hypothetical protein
VWCAGRSDQCRSRIGIRDVEHLREAVLDEDSPKRGCRNITRPGELHGLHEQVGHGFAPEQPPPADEIHRQEDDGRQPVRAKDRKGIGQVVAPAVVERDDTGRIGQRDVPGEVLGQLPGAQDEEAALSSTAI